MSESTLDSGTPTRRAWTWGRAAVLVVVLVVGAALGVDRIVPPPPEPELLVAPEGEARTGSRVCVVGGRGGGAEVSLHLARPGIEEDLPARLDVEVVRDGGLRALPVPELLPGSVVPIEIDGAGPLPTRVRWRDAPVAVERSWSTGGRLPPGLVAGPCAAVVSERAVIPGLTTLGGAEARVRLANPFPGDASVRIGFLAPEGPEDPLVLENISVPAFETREVVINEHLPERADLAAIVDVRAGRVAVEGVQAHRAAIGGIDAVSLLAASTSPSEQWTLPWLGNGPADRSWLWITNLGSRDALVELALATGDGGLVPDGLGELTVEAGSQLRVDLRGTIPEDRDRVSLVVRSPGAPVHVSAGIERRADRPADTAMAVQLGIPEPDALWVVTGGPSAERDERLRLVNPGSEPAVVDVAVFADGRLQTPAEFAGLEVGPGAAAEVRLSEVLGEVDAWAAFVIASEGELVVGRVGERRRPPAAPPPDVDDEAPDDEAPEDAVPDDEAEGPDEDAPEDAVPDDEAEGPDVDAPDEDAPDSEEDTRREPRAFVLAAGTPSHAFRPLVAGRPVREQPGLVHRFGTATSELR